MLPRARFERYAGCGTVGRKGPLSHPLRAAHRLSLRRCGRGDGVVAEQFEPFRTYCRGSYFLEQRTSPTIRRAAEFFERSLQAHRDYVPLLIDLARAHQFLGTYWHVPPKLAFLPALEAVEKALAIDPQRLLKRTGRKLAGLNVSG
jgi:hypothetical protein